MKTMVSVFAICFCFFSCTNSEIVPSETIESLKAELASANEKIEYLQSRNSTKSVLQHTIYFTLKSDLTEEKRMLFIEQLEGLAEIEVVQKVTAEARKNVGDEGRALKQFDVVMVVTLENEAALKIYDASEIHQNLKKSIGNYLAGPPASFDFVVD
jgi:lipopolysaccharide export LptBFGC system permease protein LptF